MLTNNFYRVMATVMTASSTPTAYYIKLPDGTTQTCAFNTAKSPNPLRSGSLVTDLGSAGYATWGYCLGRGSTPATKEDYKLEDMITSGLSQIASSFANQWDDTGVENVWSYTLKNTSDADIEIFEIGKIGSHSAGRTELYTLIDRTVLDTPIIIPAGETKVLSYTIRINYPA